MEGYRLSSKDRLGSQEGGVTLYINDQLDCTELCLGMNEDPTKGLLVRIKGRAGTRRYSANLLQGTQPGRLSG